MPSITKPCHNCRRRRLRCDRSWPSCHKCDLSGQECLGYGRVFVWTQTIDPHGNLKPSSTSSSTSTASSAAATFSKSSLRSPGCLRHGKPSPGLPRPLPTPAESGPTTGLSRPRNTPQSGPDDGRSLEDDGRLLIGNPRDPVFQDLDHDSRYYLCHCGLSSSSLS